MIVTRIILCAAVVLSTLEPAQAAVNSDVEAMTRDIIQAITTFNFTTARALYDVIKENGHLDVCAFQLASSLRKTMLSNEFEQLSSETKDEFEKLKENLPISVKNSVFASSVCIHNLNFNEYLFSPNEDYIHDSQNRNVFLWRLGSSNVPGSNWTLEATNSSNEWKIVNIYGEYLVADTSFYSINRRQVFTYMPLWTGSTANVWHFYANGDELTLQNVWFGNGNSDYSYLYGASNLYNFDGNRRRVFDWDNNWDFNDKTHLWRIEEC